MRKVRSLIYVPILHTQREAGDILVSLKASGSEKHTPGSVAEQEKSVKEMWDGIYEKIREINISSSSSRIYQDALPVCGRESEIVTKLAQKGSRNHQLILELMKKGAHLEGTENPDLLIREYDYLTQLLGTLTVSTQIYQEAMEEYKNKSMELMKQRDAFIAERIKSTIRNGEISLVFMGVRHQLEKFLQSHFVISYIIYRLPFRKIRDIYNI